MIKLRGYIFSRPFMGERVPQHVQNLVIRDYCERNQLQYLLSGTEYAMQSSHLILQQILDEINAVDGICAYSLFQLPEKVNAREKIYEKMLDNKKEFHFAVEGLRLASPQECERVELVWRVRQTLQHCRSSLF
jgi:sporadic carbohydrate cluster protein (TIGR04323 family)